MENLNIVSAMSLRQDLLNLIETLSDEQLSVLMPIAMSLRSKPLEDSSIETSQAYQEWLSTENDIYDEVFSDELAAW
jgi:hypothetical protein